MDRCPAGADHSIFARRRELEPSGIVHAGEFQRDLLGALRRVAGLGLEPDLDARAPGRSRAGGLVCAGAGGLGGCVPLSRLYWQGLAPRLLPKPAVRLAHRRGLRGQLAWRLAGLPSRGLQPSVAVGCGPDRRFSSAGVGRSDRGCRGKNSARVAGGTTVAAAALAPGDLLPAHSVGLASSRLDALEARTQPHRLAGPAHLERKTGDVGLVRGDYLPLQRGPDRPGFLPGLQHHAAHHRLVARRHHRPECGRKFPARAGKWRARTAIGFATGRERDYLGALARPLGPVSARRRHAAGHLVVLQHHLRAERGWCGHPVPCCHFSSLAGDRALLLAALPRLRWRIPLDTRGGATPAADAEPRARSNLVGILQW